MRFWNNGWRVLALLLAAPVLVAAKQTNMATPGTLNYMEGQVVIDGQTLSPKSVDSTALGANGVLHTQQGKAELLLIPGVFLRVGNDSEVRMISPDLADTKAELVKGTAMLEVDELFKENNLSMEVDNGTVRIEKKGLYDFNATPATVGVLDGKAKVYFEDAQVTLKKGHEVLLASEQPLKAKRLDEQNVESGSLYRWSKLRSNYESQANVDAASAVLAYGGWYGPGWYWATFWTSYAFLPGNGFFFNPFGWGFYSPAWVWRSPYYGYYIHRYPVIISRGYRFPRTVVPHPRATAPGFHHAPPHALAPRLSAPRLAAPRTSPFPGGIREPVGGFHGGGWRR